MKNTEIVKYDLTKIKSKNWKAKKWDYVLITKINLWVYTWFLWRIKKIDKDEIIITCVRYEYWCGEITDVTINRKDETFKMEFSSKEKFIETFIEIQKKNNEKIKEQEEYVEKYKENNVSFIEKWNSVLSNDFFKENEKEDIIDISWITF